MLLNTIKPNSRLSGVVPVIYITDGAVSACISIINFLCSEAVANPFILVLIYSSFYKLSGGLVIFSKAYVVI